VLNVIAKTKRDDLFQEIFNTLHQWPEVERKVFTRAHYHGQSADVISRALNLDPAEVRLILKRCNSQLQTSLSKFRKTAAGNLCLSGLVQPLQCAEP
jgi:DNA-directed RNA polymerase specialized sigma24 family protein